MKTALFVLDEAAFASIYGDEVFQKIASLVVVLGPPLTATALSQAPGLLAGAELIFSGWGPPMMGPEFLRDAPRLEAVFYGAGSVRKFVTDAVWERGIRVTSAAAINAIPVAELTLAEILFSLKHGWSHVREPVSNKSRAPGAYETKVGLISLGAIGRRVAELLKPFDLEVLAYDPHAGQPVFDDAAARRVAGLDELFSKCDVISLHAPNLPPTRGMITGAHFERMKPGATFINTARGDIVRESEMTEVLSRRPDIWAVLDVLANGARAAGSQLSPLPNVVITPHIAGSMGHECRRMGRAMLDELKRYLRQEPMAYEITPERFALLA